MKGLCLTASVAESAPVVRTSELISALSFALDLTEGQAPGHSLRSCILGMRLAAEIGLAAGARSDLYYALLLKDAGCSSNASKLFHIINADEIRAKRDVKDKEWTRLAWESLRYAIDHVATNAPFLERLRTLISVTARRHINSKILVNIRCERGSSIARRMGFSEAVANGIFYLDEHWDGGGYPDGLRGEEIPIISRIMSLAQTLAVFYGGHGAEAAIAAAHKRSGRWFDPSLVKAAASLHQRKTLWTGLDRPDLMQQAAVLEPREREIVMTDAMLDNICLAFAEVIDAKSPFTYRHSNGVAEAAVGIARNLGMPHGEIAFIRRAALLHDIGKLSVPNTILEKPGPLTTQEWDVVKQHPSYTLEILRRIPGFGDLSDVAAAHHEKLDGSGYFRGWSAEQMNLPARILAVADIYDALAARRPYRDAMPEEAVFEILRRDAPKALDAECVEALAACRKNSSLEALASAVR
ncbi:MAG TPA: HD domain-containing phosphohydrolase [Bryobacteraceae bacterium]|nr:HD domain-containing phosphohydrolase [Bryobacteraceae bacterium]